MSTEKTFPAPLQMLEYLFTKGWKYEHTTAFNGFSLNGGATLRDCDAYALQKAIELAPSVAKCAEYTRYIAGETNWSAVLGWQVPVTSVPAASDVPS